MVELPSRDIYITIDGKVYKLLYSLYGLKDATKVFNDGLVSHLKEGGYWPSVWDKCLSLSGRPHLALSIYYFM